MKQKPTGLLLNNCNVVTCWVTVYFFLQLEQAEALQQAIQPTELATFIVITAKTISITQNSKDSN